MCTSVKFSRCMQVIDSVVAGIKEIAGFSTQILIIIFFIDIRLFAVKIQKADFFQTHTVDSWSDSHVRWFHRVKCLDSSTCFAYSSITLHQQLLRSQLWNTVAGLMDLNKVNYQPFFPSKMPFFEEKIKADRLSTLSSQTTNNTQGQVTELYVMKELRLSCSLSMVFRGNTF